MNHTRAMARLYAEAFAAAPSLADDLGAGHRYNAARAAARAGCGHGADTTGLGEEERHDCEIWRGSGCERIWPPECAPWTLAKPRR
jgi:hypothetical protein